MWRSMPRHAGHISRQLPASQAFGPASKKGVSGAMEHSTFFVAAPTALLLSMLRARRDQPQDCDHQPGELRRRSVRGHDQHYHSDDELRFDPRLPSTPQTRLCGLNRPRPNCAGVIRQNAEIADGRIIPACAHVVDCSGAVPRNGTSSQRRTTFSQTVVSSTIRALAMASAAVQRHGNDGSVEALTKSIVQVECQDNGARKHARSSTYPIAIPGLRHFTSAGR